MIKKKLENLENYLKELGSIAVAYSAGVDSTFLLKTAHNVLKDKVIAITAVSEFSPTREISQAKTFCYEEKIKHITFNFHPLDIKNIEDNPLNRCYVCKNEIMKNIINIASENGIENIADGSNIDDIGDFRPGTKALKELNIKSPLQYAELTKSEIRELSKEMGLNTWDKPSSACLASRFMYGEKITTEKLQMVDNAEVFLLKEGFKICRVRIHDKLARIEVLPEDFEKLILYNEIITKKFEDFGFKYVSMDLKGYRTGSMNEIIETH